MARYGKEAQEPGPQQVQRPAHLQRAAPRRGARLRTGVLVTRQSLCSLLTLLGGASATAWLRTSGNDRLFYAIMIFGGDQLVSESHFSFEKWHPVPSAFTLLPYFCMFLWLLLCWGEQLQATETLGFFFF